MALIHAFDAFDDEYNNRNKRIKELESALRKIRSEIIEPLPRDVTVGRAYIDSIFAHIKFQCEEALSKKKI